MGRIPLVVPSLVAALLPLLTATAVSAQCGCVGPGDEVFQAGLVYRGDRPLSLDEIAHVVAPALMYSEDEPLITDGEVPLPHAHPCDPAGQPEKLGVVYYQPLRIQLRNVREKVSLPAYEDPEFWAKVQTFKLRFYFYYRWDMGAGAHTHDLEPTDFYLRIEDEDGCYSLILERVVAQAHGTDWYSNELVLTADTRFPIHLFVEEGKHASCPDRNADGMYTPGYDVNRRVQDAWGVRDVFGSGFLISSGFQASMTKARYPRFRVLPPENPDLCLTDRNQALRGDVFEAVGIDVRKAALNEYELRPATSLPICDVDDHGDFLRYMEKSHGFGASHEPDQFQFQVVGELTQGLTSTESLVSSVSMRWDRDLGVTANLRGADLQQVYLVPKINWIFVGDFAVEAMIIGSAAKFWDSYVSVGVARERKRVRTSDGLELSTGHETNFVAESGLKFRLRVAGKLRLLTFGYQFAGARIGVRGSGFDDIDQIRLIGEIGAGVW